jgi:hypothetical protein
MYADFQANQRLFKDSFILITRTVLVKPGLLQWRRADERGKLLNQQHTGGSQ